MILRRSAVAAALALPLLAGLSPLGAEERPSAPQKLGTQTAVDDEKAEQARRALDMKAERLEREARKVMTTICRGC